MADTVGNERDDREARLTRQAIHQVRLALLGAPRKRLITVLGVGEPGFRKQRRHISEGAEKPMKLGQPRRDALTIAAQAHAAFSFRTAKEWSLTADTLRCLLIQYRTYEELEEEFVPLARRHGATCPGDSEIKHLEATARWALWTARLDPTGKRHGSLAEAEAVKRLWQNASRLTNGNKRTEQRVYERNARTVEVYQAFLNNHNSPVADVDWYKAYREDAEYFGDFTMWRDTVEQAAVNVRAKNLNPTVLEDCIDETRAAIEERAFITTADVREVVMPELASVDAGELVRESAAYLDWMNAVTEVKQ